jgi:hypothetical protein
MALLEHKNLDLDTAKGMVLHMNSKLIEPLLEQEIERTIFQTMGKF